MNVLIKFYRFTSIYDQNFLDNETITLGIFFEIYTEERFVSYILSNEGYIKASILLILLKCVVVGYSNGSFRGRLFSNYGPLNMLFHFFRYLIYSVFHETFVKLSMKKLYFSAQVSKTHFKITIILKWLRSEYGLKS